jgi:hypothetical protein
VIGDDGEAGEADTIGNDSEGMIRLASLPGVTSLFW